MTGAAMVRLLEIFWAAFPRDDLKELISFWKDMTDDTSVKERQEEARC